MTVATHNIKGTTVKIGTAAERAAHAATTVGAGTTFWETDTGKQFISDGTSWLQYSTGGAANVSEFVRGSQVAPGFSIGIPLQLTVSSTKMSVPIGDATMFELKGLSATSQKIAIRFGTALSDAISATLEYQFNANTLSVPLRFSLPNGVTYLHLIRNDAADVSVQLTLS